MSLQGKRIVVGLGGGIAAFKAVQLVRELMRRGAEVRVVMTEAATHFVGPITFAGLTGKPAVTNLWAENYAGEVHVELGEWADAVVIAPATMNLMARATSGQANDVVLATLACARGDVFFAPSMHHRMWAHPATQSNIRTLTDRGAVVLGPVTGALANGEIGEGRMMEPDDIADEVESHSGRMGYAIASQALRRGAEVTIVSGPVHLPVPSGAEVVRVRSAQEMHAAVMSRFDRCDVLIMAAAVADYRPEQREAQKIKKGGSLKLELVRNPDILADVGAKRSQRPSVLVGFALETENLEQAARDKLERKAADLIVANEASAALGGDTNRATLVEAASTTPLPEMTKRALANQILDRVRTLLTNPSQRPRREAKQEAPN
ncbi:MAG: bifunctional phosphopantothenoylcysteine decarboxylase/phosphopantothenate synthase [Deltaproteobacteria bacterium]|nr:bifunctional phosphopantothenoylcysteine decarboxylase/phosphopantothenate synthase [Deltaproteobacteria bacterium]